jgi:hypothetical protein
MDILAIPVAKENPSRKGAAQGSKESSILACYNTLLETLLITFASLPGLAWNVEQRNRVIERIF